MAAPNHRAGPDGDVKGAHEVLNTRQGLMIAAKTSARIGPMPPGRLHEAANRAVVRA